MVKCISEILSAAVVYILICTINAVPANQSRLEKPADLTLSQLSHTSLNGQMNIIDLKPALFALVYRSRFDEPYVNPTPSSAGHSLKISGRHIRPPQMYGFETSTSIRNGRQEKERTEGRIGVSVSSGVSLLS